MAAPTSYDFAGLKQLWIANGGQKSLAPVMAAIALAESSGRMNAIDNDSNGSTDYGLWQINSVHGYNSAQLLSNANYNAQAAVAVLNSQGLGAWTTYTSGAYRQYLNGAHAPGLNANTGKSSMYTRPGGSPSADTGVGSILAGWSSEEQAIPSLPNQGVQTTSFLSGIFSVPDLTAIPNPLTFVSDLVNGVGSVTDFLQALVWILNPVNILRMVEFLTGLVLMGFGIHAAIQSAGERAEGYQTSENAISRSGLGRVSRELAAGAKSRSRPARPAPAPHATRRTALRTRYEREQQVSKRRTEQRRKRASATVAKLAK